MKNPFYSRYPGWACPKHKTKDGLWCGLECCKEKNEALGRIVALHISETVGDTELNWQMCGICGFKASVEWWLDYEIKSLTDFYGVNTLVEVGEVQELENREHDFSKSVQNPYIEKTEISMAWNPKYDQDALCECGHAYYRHFDTYDDMEPAGCKYCLCFTFKAKG